ncbi:MAG TPA: condensation domain-containing protein, partial [Thermoanaerobaculia bacterium]|nr:condensation domain-containing protein [Thermoanaerobaculia bacterium]
SVVLARLDTPGDPRLVAYVVPRVATLAARELSDHLAQSLPSYMVPSRFVFLATLPLQPNGKVDRRALPSPGALAAGEREAFVAPRTQIEEVLAGIWAEALGVARVGVQDNFFALGGHSLMAPRTLSRVRQAFGVELPLRALFHQPTVAGMAERVTEVMAEARGREPVAEPPLVPTAPMTPMAPMTDRGGPQPLAAAQLRFWLRRHEGGGASNVPLGLRLKGPLQHAALAGSLTEIWRRHEVLRAAFLEVDGEPVQVIRDDRRLALTQVDLSALPHARREAELFRLGSEEAAHPFDLAAEPLLRVTLLPLGGEEHALFLLQHHMITDGWSQGVLADELARLYEAALQGLPSPLPELPIQYGDYSAWQRERLSGPFLAELAAYWRERLRGLPVLPLPTDRPRPAQRSVRGGRSHRQLDPALCRGLRGLARSENASLFMTLLAAWNALLCRWTGETDVTVTTNLASRNRPEIERLLGLFTNALALRTDLAGDPTFRELLGRVRETTLEAYSHQDLPFVEVLRQAHPGRSARYNELFPVGFVLQNFPVRPLSLPGLEVERLDLAPTGSPRDLILLVAEAGEQLKAVLLYREDIFEPATPESLLTRYESLLATVIQNPDCRLSAL